MTQLACRLLEVDADSRPTAEQATSSFSDCQKSPMPYSPAPMGFRGAQGEGAQEGLVASTSLAPTSLQDEEEQKGLVAPMGLQGVDHDLGTVTSQGQQPTGYRKRSNVCSASGAKMLFNNLDAPWWSYTAFVW